MSDKKDFQTWMQDEVDKYPYPRSVDTHAYRKRVLFHVWWMFVWGLFGGGQLVAWLFTGATDWWRLILGLVAIAFAYLTSQDVRRNVQTLEMNSWNRAANIENYRWTKAVEYFNLQNDGEEARNREFYNQWVIARKKNAMWALAYAQYEESKKGR